MSGICGIYHAIASYQRAEPSPNWMHLTRLTILQSTSDQRDPVGHLLAIMQNHPLGPIKRQMYEHQFREMEDRMKKNLIAEAAAYISGMGMLTYPIPMFYQV